MNKIKTNKIKIKQIKRAKQVKQQQINAETYFAPSLPVKHQQCVVIAQEVLLRYLQNQVELPESYNDRERIV